MGDRQSAQESGDTALEKYSAANDNSDFHTVRTLVPGKVRGLLQFKEQVNCINKNRSADKKKKKKKWSSRRGAVVNESD